MECIKNEKTMDKQREIELTEFQCWILKCHNFGEQLMIIKQEDLEKVIKSKDDDEELDIKYIESSDFYSEFEKLLDIYDFDENFVSMKYIDRLENSVSLTINVNGRNELFRVDIA